MPTRTAPTRYVLLLRGVNLAGRNRIRMGELRDVLEGRGGLEDVRTYLQSGNVVLSSTVPSGRIGTECRSLLAIHFGLDVDVIVRTRDQLAEVVARNPLANVVDDPRRYQVTFLERELEPEVVGNLMAAAMPGESVDVIGREVYAWHPHGIGRSKLATVLAGTGLGVPATARNWRTVTAVLDLARAG